MAEQDLVCRGKSKDVFRISEGPYAGKYRMVFTDRATGYLENGKPVFDPGRDVVVGEIPGKGVIACRFAAYFFRLLKQKGIPSHFIDTAGEREMIVEPARPLGMAVEAPEVVGAAPLLNLEFTWRNSATGSFWRRYPFVRPCKALHQVVEVWTKGDSDTLITTEALEAAGAMSRDEIRRSVELVKEVAALVTREFAPHGLHVLDGKFELGRLNAGDGAIVLIDEISPDVLRVCKGYAPDPSGDCTLYDTCVKTACTDGKRTLHNVNQVAAADFINIFL